MEIVTLSGEIDDGAACRPGALQNAGSSWAVLRLPPESHLSLLVTMRDIEPAQMLLHFAQIRPEERELAPQVGDLSMGKVIFFVRSAS